jgi:hypothetical protein
MEEKTMDKNPEESSSTLYYVVGAIVLIAVVAAGYFLRPKSTTQTQPTAVPAGPTPTPGPITGLACERQYYNPVVGFEKYFISAEGVDTTGTNNVTCDFTMTVAGAVVATASESSNVLNTPERGGVSFKCTTKPVELKRNVPTKVDVTVTSDRGQTTTCSQTFVFP